MRRDINYRNEVCLGRYNKSKDKELKNRVIFKYLFNFMLLKLIILLIYLNSFSWLKHSYRILL